MELQIDLHLGKRVEPIPIEIGLVEIVRPLRCSSPKPSIRSRLRTPTLALIRKGAQRRLGDPFEFLAACPAGRLHRHALRSRWRGSGQARPGRRRRKDRHPSWPASAGRGCAPGCRRGGSRVPGGCIGVGAASERALHGKAPLRMAGIGQELGAAAQQSLGHAPRRRRLEGLCPIGGPNLAIAVERLAEQPLFIAERGIEARRIDAHGGVRSHRVAPS